MDLISEDQVKHIALKDIYIDEKWNARSAANVQSETAGYTEDVDGKMTIEEGNGLTGLMAGMMSEGQKTPVDIRKTSNGFYTKTDKPYALVSGFRRFAAVSKANASTDLVKIATDGKRTVIPNTANGTIRAIVHETMTETEARKLNLLENTQRANIKGPDAMAGILELYGAHKMSQKDISVALGISQPHVNNLINIGTKVERKIVDHWRNGGKFGDVVSGNKATFADMLSLSRLDKDRQAEEYVKMITPKAGAEKDDKQWLTAAKKAAEKFAVNLAKLQKLEFLEVTQDVAWIDVLGVMVSAATVKRAKARQERAIADAAEKAFAKELNRTEETEEGGEEGDERDE